jgi:hypothetical protein
MATRTPRKTPARPATRAAAAPKAAQPAKPVKAATPAAPGPAKASAPAAASKPAKAAKPAKAPKASKSPKAAKPEKAPKPAKDAKPKLVRDSFTIPKAEYAVLDTLKVRAARAGHPAKKSELLRAGIQLLAALPDAGFLAAVQAVESLKTGRPAKA